MKTTASLILSMAIFVVPHALGGPDTEDTPQTPVSPATINRIFKEAEAAFSNKDYGTSVAKCEELLKMLGPGMDRPREILYFQIGQGNLLGGKYPEAVTAFKNYIKNFPKGEYTTRAYLGLGRAYKMQKLPDKKEEALEALKKAATDPKYKAEADVLISEISQAQANP
jgi:TolA-binding protein